MHRSRSFFIKKGGILPFLPPVCGKSDAAHIFPHSKKQKDSKPKKQQKSTLIFTEGGYSNGSFPHRKNQGLHRHVEPPFAKHRTVPESKGAIIHDSVSPRGMELYHQRACFHL